VTAPEALRGRAMHKIVFYGLSTCGWCKKMKQFLDSSGLQYELIYVDKLQGEDRRQVTEQVKRWNPRVSFPTVVINDSEAIIGYRESQIREALDL
jgi:glutaredoxin-like protein NrdH